jgi:hypothetical protein
MNQGFGGRGGGSNVYPPEGMNQGFGGRGNGVAYQQYSQNGRPPLSQEHQVFQASKLPNNNNNNTYDYPSRQKKMSPSNQSPEIYNATPIIPSQQARPPPLQINHEEYPPSQNQKINREKFPSQSQINREEFPPSQNQRVNRTNYGGVPPSHQKAVNREESHPQTQINYASQNKKKEFPSQSQINHGEFPPPSQNRYGEPSQFTPPSPNRYGEFTPPSPNRYGEFAPPSPNRYGEFAPPSPNRYGEFAPPSPNRYTPPSPSRKQHHQIMVQGTATPQPPLNPVVIMEKGQVDHSIPPVDRPLVWLTSLEQIWDMPLYHDGAPTWKFWFIVIFLIVLIGWCSVIGMSLRFTFRFRGGGSFKGNYNLAFFF